MGFFKPRSAPCGPRSSARSTRAPVRRRCPRSAIGCARSRRPRRALHRTAEDDFKHFGHELRTPLNAMAGWGQIIRADPRRPRRCRRPPMSSIGAWPRSPRRSRRTRADAPLRVREALALERRSPAEKSALHRAGRRARPRPRQGPAHRRRHPRLARRGRAPHHPHPAHRLLARQGAGSRARLVEARHLPRPRGAAPRRRERSPAQARGGAGAPRLSRALAGARAPTATVPRSRGPGGPAPRTGG